MRRIARLNRPNPVLPLALPITLSLALSALLIGLAAFAALSIFAADRASAQDAESLSQVRNRAAPTLSATVDERGIVLSWTLNAGNPTGWKVKEFAFLRQVGNEAAAALSNTASGPDRTFIDGMDTDTKYKYWDGTDLTYTMRAVYERLSDGATLPGKQSNSATVEGAYTTSQVRAGHEPHNVTVTAHATHVLVEWEFDEANNTPPGWKLIGFAAGRYLSSNIHDVTMFLPLEKKNQDPDQRSAKDPMSGVSEAQRMPGFEWNYGVLAYFERLASGNYGSRKQGNAVILVFTAPTLPPPTNVTVETTSLASQIWRNDYVRWSPPHLNWDASLGFNSVSEYIIYRFDSTSEWLRSNPRYDSVSFTTVNTCHFGFWVRARVGLFFSDEVRATNNRTYPCN